MFVPTTNNCDQYAAERDGKYEYRAVRYRAAIDAMFAMGLDDTMTIMDVGAGMTEFDYCIRREYNWRGRYIPIDGGIDGTNLNTWVPPRRVHFFVALEILEHLYDWEILVGRMRSFADIGIVVSTPDSGAVDVLAMDPTHVVGITQGQLVAQGFTVTRHKFYGGFYGLGEHNTDGLLGVWKR